MTSFVTRSEKILQPVSIRTILTILSATAIELPPQCRVILKGVMLLL